MATDPSDRSQAAFRRAKRGRNFCYFADQAQEREPLFRGAWACASGQEL